LAVDAAGERLFVSALGNNSLEVLDLKKGVRLRSIPGLREPQGVYYVARVNRLYVANSDDGTLRVYDATTYKPLSTLNYASDADNVRYDPARKQIYVGYGTGTLGIIDTISGQKIAEIPLAGHPESFRLEAGGPRIFVNVPTAHHTIAVVDRVKRSVVANWQVDAADNFPMALDEPDHRLLIATRNPARLIAIDTETGKPVASVDAVGDADDLFFDAEHKRVYISGGEGFLDVFDHQSAGHFERTAHIPTAKGARTSLFVPELNRLYLAVPHRGSQGAEIRVYEVQP